MIEKYVKRGIMKGTARKFVTSIELPFVDIMANLFFIDADRNLVSPHVYVRGVLIEFLQENKSFELGLLQAFVRKLDEDAVANDYVISDLLLVIEQGESKHVVSVGAGGLMVYVFDHWAFSESSQLYRTCEFENGGSRFHYIGSGAAIGAEGQFGKHEDLLLVTLDTMLHFRDSCDKPITSSFFYRKEGVNYPTIFDKIQSMLATQRFKTSKDMFVAAVFSKLDLTKNNEEIDLN